MAPRRRTRIARRWALLLLAPLAPGIATAGPPYVTDDPEPTDLAKWEVYGFAAGTLFHRAADGAGGFDVNYGGAKNLQLSAVVTLAYAREAGGPARAGVADTELGAKYRFLRQHDGGWMPDVALYPKIELPTAGRRFGSGRVGFSVPLWLEKDLGAWSLFGGGGWAYHPGAGARNYGFGGVALTRAVSGRLALGGEITHRTADAVDTRASTGLGVGASWQVARSWSIIGSGGPVVEHRASAGRYAFYLALAFRN